MKENLNVLLTSVGRRTYLVEYFRAALGGRGEVHAANSAWTYPMQVADRALVTPLIYDGGYIEALLAYCQEWDIGAVLSLFDIDLPVLAESRARFEEIGVRLVVSDLEVTRICNDKWRTYEFLRQHGFAAPATYLSREECERALASGEARFPLFVKPRWGMGSIGIFRAENPRELEVFSEKVRAEIARSYLRYESRQAPEESVMIQGALVGEEYGLDVLNDLGGEFLTCVPKRKVAMRAGETDSAEIVADPELHALGRRLSGALGHIANLDVDCFWDGNECSVLELNCRFGGQYPFSHLAGADFPGAIVAMLRGEPVPGAMLCARPGTLGFKDLRPVLLRAPGLEP